MLLGLSGLNACYNAKSVRTSFLKKAFLNSLNNKLAEAAMRSRDLRQPRFAIRKLTIGAVSVMFGAVIFAVSAGQVEAAENKPAQAVATEVDKGAATKGKVDTAIPAERAHVVIPDKNNKPATEPKINDNVAKDVSGRETHQDVHNVFNKGKIQFDYSITGQDKDGHVDEVKSDAPGHEAQAYIDLKQGRDFEAHLILKNLTDQDLLIDDSWGGYITTQNYHENKNFLNGYLHKKSAQLRIRSTNGLKVSGDDEDYVTETNKDGQVIQDPEFDIYYEWPDKYNQWYQPDEVDPKVRRDTLMKTTHVGFQGVLKAGATAVLHVPLVADADTKQGGETEIIPEGDNLAAIRVYNKQSPDPLWDLDDVKDDPIHLTYRDGDNYVMVPDNDNLQLPDIAAVVTIPDSGNAFDESGHTYYQGGTFHINLQKIQEKLAKDGFTVNPAGLAQGYYSYSPSNEQQMGLKDPAGKQVVTQPGQPFFYIEVHRVLSAGDAHFVEHSLEANHFQAQNLLKAVYNLTPKTGTGHFGQEYQEKMADPRQVGLKISDAQGQPVARIDGETPAGTYFVSFTFLVNGSIPVSKTVQVVIDPDQSKAEDPDGPEVPAVPVEPETSEEPALPNTSDEVNPTLPDLPTGPELPVSPIDSPVLDFDGPAAPNLLKVMGITSSPATFVPKKTRVFRNDALVVKKTSAVKAVKTGRKAALPQTGSNSAVGVVGMLAALLSLLGLGFRKDRK
jgi:LPXTG-motif cell wall-anchored protein